MTMKKLIFPLLLAGLFAVPSPAHSATNPYVSISGGLGLMNNSSDNGVPDEITFKTGYLINGAVGLKNDMFRLEAEIGYHRNAPDTWGGGPATGYISLWSFMANGYIDFDMKESGISPYIMAGLGCADATDHYTANYSDTVFAWQAGAGIGIKAGDKVTVDIGYRYFKPSDVEWSDGVSTHTYSLGSHNIVAGIRYNL
jgi:opacity protein-like surface antigen